MGQVFKSRDKVKKIIKEGGGGGGEGPHFLAGFFFFFLREREREQEGEKENPSFLLMIHRVPSIGIHQTKNQSSSS